MDNLLSETNKKKYDSISDEIDGEYPKIMEEMKNALCSIERRAKESKGIYTEPEDDITNIKRHLENTLKWLADDVVHYNKVISPKDRKVRLNIIGDFVSYIRNYEENQRALTEYRAHQERGIDDGR